MKKQYFPELSLLSVFYCILVIFIHSSAQPVSYLPENSFGYLAIMPLWRMAGCAVTGFFFLSGFKFILNHYENFDYSQFIFKRLKTIFLPYCMYSIIYYFYDIVSSGKGFSLLDLFASVITGSAAGHLYFIIALLQFYILAPLWIYIFKKFSVKTILIFSAIITVSLGFILPVFLPYDFSNRVFVKYLLFWILGCCFGINVNKLRECVKDLFLPLLFAFLISAATDIILYSYATTRLLFLLRESFRVIYCTLAAIFFYNLSVRASLHMKSSSLLNTLSASTFTAYLLHPLIISCIDRLLYTANFGLLESFVIRLLATITITGSVSIVWTCCKRRFLRKNQSFQ